MRYKCTDCGQEYDLKPEFCDCGNNVFSEIPTANEKIEQKQEFTPKRPLVDKTSSTPVKSRRIDIPSLLIFLLCIFLSILSLIFIGRDTEPKAENVADKQVQTSVKSIPSIDRLWSESAPVISNPEKTQKIEVVAVKPAEKTQSKTTTPKTTKTTNVSKPAAKTVQQTQQSSQQRTVVQPQTSMTEQEKQELIQKLSSKKTPQQKPATSKTEPQKTDNTLSVVQPKQEQVKTEVKQEVKAPDATQLKKEYDAYKLELQNKLGKSINFGAVIGDGKCAVTFKLDATGNLVSRKFASQSQNNSLNDAVYAAMLANPTFREPPMGYKGETLTLSVTMYGGNFEVKLK